MKSTRMLRLGGLLVVLALLATACGGAPSAEAQEFCDDYVAVRQLIDEGPAEDDPAPWQEEAASGLEGLETTAPESVSVAVDGVVGALLQPVQNLDEEAFMAAITSADFGRDTGEIDRFLVDECGVESVSVTAVDYGFEADLEGLEAGRVSIAFANEGSELHEMVLLRINDDTTETLEELLALPEEEGQSKTTFVGVSFAASGESNTMYADLEPGRYAVVCFIPTGSLSFDDLETADGPPHFAHGMHAEFTVEA